MLTTDGNIFSIIGESEGIANFSDSVVRNGGNAASVEESAVVDKLKMNAVVQSNFLYWSLFIVLILIFNLINNQIKEIVEKCWHHKKENSSRENYRL